MYHCEQFSIKLPALWTSLNVPSEVLSTIFFECFIDFLSDRAKGCFFCWSFYLFVFLVQTVMTVHCTLMVTCGDLLTLLYVVTCCVLLYIVLFSCIVLSVSCSLVVTCWEGADLWAVLYMVLSSDFVTFQFDILG